MRQHVGKGGHPRPVVLGDFELLDHLSAGFARTDHDGHGFPRRLAALYSRKVRSPAHSREKAVGRYAAGFLLRLPARFPVPSRFKTKLTSARQLKTLFDFRRRDVTAAGRNSRGRAQD
jgi:hypothetical protein